MSAGSSTIDTRGGTTGSLGSQSADHVSYMADFSSLPRPALFASELQSYSTFL